MLKLSHGAVLFGSKFGSAIYCDAFGKLLNAWCSGSMVEKWGKNGDCEDCTHTFLYLSDYNEDSE